MRVIIDKTPHVGAKYGSMDKTFVITELPVIENDQWVEYFNQNTNHTYSCRLEAFLARFSPLPE